MKKLIGKMLVLNKTTVVNLSQQEMLRIQGGHSLENGWCKDSTTDSDPPTIVPCPTTGPPSKLDPTYTE